MVSIGGMAMRDIVEIGEFIGKTFMRVQKIKLGTAYTRDGDIVVLVFEMKDGTKYRMYHDQDCCEYVYLEDVIGDLKDLVGVPILKASEDSNTDEMDGTGPLDDNDESHTWTFYNISTIKGTVTLRWYGTSNGYYSESVDIEKVA
jgi:hypothetical protein